MMLSPAQWHKDGNRGEEKQDGHGYLARMSAHRYLRILFGVCAAARCHINREEESEAAVGGEQVSGLVVDWERRQIGKLIIEWDVEVLYIKGMAYAQTALAKLSEWSGFSKKDAVLHHQRSTSDQPQISRL